MGGLPPNRRQSRRLSDTAGSARGGFDGGRQVCRGRDWGWLCRRQRFVASGKFTDPGAEFGDPGL
jgi:hypothetical protein